jgi:hypothetical protein
MANDSQSDIPRFSLRTLMLFVAVVGAFLVLGKSIVSSEPSRWIPSCTNNLKQIGIALLNKIPRWRFGLVWASDGALLNRKRSVSLTTH